MKWESFSAFLAMGGYGLYVWGSFGTTLGLMLLESWLVKRRRQHALSLARQTQALLEQEGRESPHETAQ